MEKINKLKEIAEFLGKEELVQELEALQSRALDQRVKLSIPLVGEFSAGKTSLLNAISDSKQLEVATKPTTATIYELHFSAQEQYASVVEQDGTERRVENISDLRNEELGDMPLVRVYDTSTRISEDIVLIDTPGLSSPDVKHKEVLFNYLPQADALFLVIDCNQQITQSLSRAIEEAALVGRKSYLIVTKCDTKHVSEIESIKSYIAKNSKLPVEHVACVSAERGELDEFYQLLERISATKQEVLLASIEAQLHRIAKTLVFFIDELLSLPSNLEELEGYLSQQESQEFDVKRELEQMLSSVEQCLTYKRDEFVAGFERNLSLRLNSLITSHSPNMTAEMNMAIDSAVEHSLSTYRAEVAHTLRDLSQHHSTYVQSAVNSLDLGTLDFGVQGFDQDLAEVGHSWDKKIAMGIQAAVIVGAVVATAGVASSALATAGGAAAAGGVASTGATVGTAVATEIGGSVATTLATKQLVKKGIEEGAKLSAKQVLTEGVKVLKSKEGRQLLMDNVSVDDLQTAYRVGQPVVSQSRGFLEGLVFMASEQLAKPRRERVVRETIDAQILPDFKFQLDQSIRVLLSLLGTALTQETESLFVEMRAQIEETKLSLRAEGRAYEERIAKLKEHKEALV